MKKNKSWLFYASAIASMVIWSFSFVWVKIAYFAYGPLTTILFRLIISSAILLVFTKLVKKLQIPTFKDFKMFMLLAFFEPLLYFMGESYGLLYISSVVGSVIVATIPLFTPITAWYFYREKLSGTNWLGLIFSFIGVSLVVLNKSFQLEASALGISLEFLAVVGAIGYATVLKGISQKYNVLTVITFQNLFGALYFIPFWLVFEMKDFTSTPFHSEAFSAILKLAIFGSSLAFIFFTYSVKNIGINKSNSFVNVIPVCVAILAYIILGDELNLQKIIGIFVVVGGLFLAQIKFKRKKNGAYPVFQS